MDTVRPRHHGTLTQPRDGDALVSVSIGPHDEAVAVWTSRHGRDLLLASDTGPRGRPIARTFASTPVSVRVRTYTPGVAETTEIAGFWLAWCSVQPLPDGRLLAAAARCRWTRRGAEHNAVIYDGDGSAVTSGTLGDGIAHLATTPAGTVWVGYFDEGIYGNRDWGGTGPEPIGSAGIVAFDQHLEQVWRLPVQAPGGPMSDCYALNVDGELAWAYYYEDFPIVRIDGDRLTTWRTPYAGARAVMTDGSRCALFGGYGEDRDLLVVGTLGDDRFHEVRRYTVTVPEAASDGAPVVCVGRGPRLHMIAGHEWSIVDIAEV